jgi:bcr-type benzoyl-CoA reductase subunit C
MVEVASHGLTRAREIYQNRPRRVRELRAQGKKVIGYLCIYPVVEMMTALDLVPYRMFGDMREPITKADTYMVTVVCPFLRSLLDLGLKGKYDFLDGVVMAHICDVGAQIPSFWNTYVQTPYSYFIDTPHTIHEEAQKQEKGLLMSFQKSLESFTGKKLTPRKLKTAIRAHNRQRALVRELYDLRKPDPPLISGTETLQVIVALMSLPVEEGNSLLKEVMDEVKERRDVPSKKHGRLLLWGPVMHDKALIEMIESLDANVVVDDTCVGSRAYFADVKLTDDPLDGLAYRYLVELKCPRTFRESVFGETRKDYKKDLASRFSYLGDYAGDWKANGAILEAVRYCDSHGYEVPAVKEYLSSIGLPSIYLEHSYSEAALAPLRTRVQGLLEIIG